MQNGMLTKLVLTASITIILVGCQSEKPTTTGSRTEAAQEAASKAARDAKEELEKTKIALSKRLDQLDAEIETLEAKAKKASAKTKAKMTAEAREMRVTTKQLRARISSWDEKAESAWRTAKREVEEDLDKTEKAIKEFFADNKG
jgi:hypothetical protein